MTEEYIVCIQGPIGRGGWKCSFILSSVILNGGHGSHRKVQRLQHLDSFSYLRGQQARFKVMRMISKAVYPFLTLSDKCWGLVCTTL